MWSSGHTLVSALSILLNVLVSCCSFLTATSVGPFFSDFPSQPSIRWPSLEPTTSARRAWWSSTRRYEARSSFSEDFPVALLTLLVVSGEWDQRGRCWNSPGHLHQPAVAGLRLQGRLEPEPKQAHSSSSNLSITDVHVSITVGSWWRWTRGRRWRSARIQRRPPSLGGRTSTGWRMQKVRSQDTKGSYTPGTRRCDANKPPKSTQAIKFDSLSVAPEKNKRQLEL